MPGGRFSECERSRDHGHDDDYLFVRRVVSRSAFRGDRSHLRCPPSIEGQGGSGSASKFLPQTTGSGGMEGSRGRRKWNASWS